MVRLSLLEIIFLCTFPIFLSKSTFLISFQVKLFIARSIVFSFWRERYVNYVGTAERFIFSCCFVRRVSISSTTSMGIFYCATASSAFFIADRSVCNIFPVNEVKHFWSDECSKSKSRTISHPFVSGNTQSAITIKNVFFIRLFPWLYFSSAFQ